VQQSTSEVDNYSSCAHSTEICRHLVQTLGVRWSIWVSSSRVGPGRGTEIGERASRSRFRSYRHRYAGKIQYAMNDACEMAEIVLSSSVANSTVTEVRSQSAHCTHCNRVEIRLCAAGTCRCALGAPFSFTGTGHGAIECLNCCTVQCDDWRAEGCTYGTGVSGPGIDPTDHCKWSVRPRPGPSLTTPEHRPSISTAPKHRLSTARVQLHQNRQGRSFGF